jgi:hypothetical protein
MSNSTQDYMNATNLASVGSNKPSPNGNESLSSIPSDIAEFDEKYGHGIGVDECLKPYLTRFANGPTGGLLLAQLAECMVRQGKKCHIVSASTATDVPLRISPGMSDTVFLTLACDRLVKSPGSDFDAVDELERDLEQQIISLLQSCESMDSVFSDPESDGVASSIDDVLWNVQNNRRMEDLPDYVIDVQRSGQDDLVVRVFQKDGESYGLKVDKLLSPFEELSDENVGDGYQVQQILQRVSGVDNVSSTNGDEMPPIPLEAIISRGFRMSIPDVGDILLSPEGSVAIHGIHTDKTMYVSSPMGVTMGNADIRQMEVVANCLAVQNVEGDGGEQSNIGTLLFRTRKPDGVLSIVDHAHLNVNDMFIEGARLVNSGRLSVTHEAILNGADIYNAGLLDTGSSSGVVSFNRVFHLYNQESGNIMSDGQLILLPAMINNAGTIDVRTLNMITTNAVENYGIIHSRGAGNITCCGNVYNHGLVDFGNVLEIRANSLNNDSGRIISRGPSKFFIRNRLDNHGSTIVDHDITESIEYHVAVPSDRSWRRNVPAGSGVDTQKNVMENRHNVYRCDPDHQSTITSYGDMSISVTNGDFDNSFGSLYALSGVNINASGDVINENGKIFSNGRAVFFGKNFRNGHVKGNKALIGARVHEIDPGVVIGLTGYGKDMDVTPLLDKMGPNGIYPFVKREMVHVHSEHLANEGASACCIDFMALRRAGITNVTFGNNTMISANTSTVPSHTPSEIVKTYKPMISYGRASAEQGQIYAAGDVEVRTDGERYLGTITSGQSILIDGNHEAGIDVLNCHDKYKLVASGDVKITLSDFSDRRHLSVQAKSLQINTEKPIVRINDMIGTLQAEEVPNIKDVDLMALGEDLGIFGNSIGELLGSFLQLPNLGGSVLVKDVRSMKFIEEPPQADVMLSTIPDYHMKQLVAMMLSPTHGRSIVDNEQLIAQLERNGHLIGDGDIRDVVAQRKQPAIVYQATGQVEEWEINGERKTVAVCVPRLIYPEIAGGELPTEVDDFHVHGAGHIKLDEGKFRGIKYHNLAVESESMVGAESKYVHSEDGKKVGIEQLTIPTDGNLSLSGDRGVYTRAVRVASGGSTQITSAHGSVRDDAMVTDTIYSTLEPPKEYRTTLFGKRVPVSRPPVQTQERKVYASTFESKKDFSMDAKRDISLESTQIAAGESVLFAGEKMIAQPAMAHKEAEYREGNTHTRTGADFPMASTFRAGKRMTFAAKDSTLMGAQILAKEIVIPEGSNAKFIPAMGHDYSHSETAKKKKFWFITLGSSREEEHRERTMPVPPTIIANDLIAPGKDKDQLGLISAIVNIPGVAVITKSLRTDTAHGNDQSSFYSHKRGLFAPRIRLNPMPALGQDFVHNFSLWDAIPTVENIIGTAAETLTQALVLSKLASNPHPLAAVANIIASKVSPLGIFNRRDTGTRHEYVPVPSEVEIGTFIVDNDETHLTGHWRVNEGHITTGKLTTDAAEQTISQTMETKEWHISLVPTAFIPGLGTGMAALMPTISVASGSGTAKTQVYDPMTLSANKLIIRCNDAVFRGTTIRGKVVDMIINNDMAVESLVNMFQSTERNDSFNVSLSALSSLASEVKALTWDQKLAAVPSIRQEKIEELHRSVDTVAQVVGMEEFYLKVGGTLYTKRAEIGLRPDGFVSKNAAERIEVNRRIEEELREINFRSRQVFNTAAVSEFGNMVGKINQLRAEVARQAAIKQLSPEDVDKLDKEVQEFLDDPEVKDSLEQLEVATIALAQSDVKLAAVEEQDPDVSQIANKITQANGNFVDISPDGVPENYDFYGDKRIIEAIAKSLPTIQGAAKYLSDPKVVAEYAVEQVRQSDFVHACLVALNNARKYCEEFGNRHPQAKKYFEKAVLAGGYFVDAVAIILSWACGPEAGIPVTGMVLASRSKQGEAAANRVQDVLSNAAKACARTDEEKQEFADTARFCLQAAGAANIVSSMHKFARHSPTPKNKPRPTESIAVREAELAGTGLKVKVPVEEHGEMPSVSRKIETQGLGDKPAPKVLSKELVIPNKINPAMRAKIESDCGVKMPDNLVGYTKHGIDRALFRDNVGVSTESILDTWNNPIKVKFKVDNSGKSFKIYGKDSTIVINPQGEVVSCWAKRKEGHRL